MNEDDLLQELGKLAREQSGSGRLLDERWDRLAAGTLSAEEERELRLLAETSEPARLAFEAFRPLGEGFHGGVVRAIVAQTQTQTQTQAQTQAAPAPGKLLWFRRALSRPVLKVQGRRLAGWTAARSRTGWRWRASSIPAAR